MWTFLTVWGGSSVPKEPPLATGLDFNGYPIVLTMPNLNYASADIGNSKWGPKPVVILTSGCRSMSVMSGNVGIVSNWSDLVENAPFSDGMLVFKR